MNEGCPFWYFIRLNNPTRSPSHVYVVSLDSVSREACLTSHPVYTIAVGVDMGAQSECE